MTLISNCNKNLYIDIFEKPEQFDEFANKLYNKLKAELKLHKI